MSLLGEVQGGLRIGRVSPRRAKPVSYFAAAQCVDCCLRGIPGEPGNIQQARREAVAAIMSGRVACGPLYARDYIVNLLASLNYEQPGLDFEPAISLDESEPTDSELEVLDLADYNPGRCADVEALVHRQAGRYGKVCPSTLAAVHGLDPYAVLAVVNMTDWLELSANEAYIGRHDPEATYHVDSLCIAEALEAAGMQSLAGVPAAGYYSRRQADGSYKQFRRAGADEAWRRKVAAYFHALRVKRNIARGIR